MRRVVWSILGVLLLGGCAAIGGGSGWDPFAGAAERRLAVRVENVSRDDVRITALAPGRRLEMGLVGGRSRRDFSIPWQAMEDVRFQIEIVAGRRHTTVGVPVAAGDRVELIVQDPIQRSIVRR